MTAAAGEVALNPVPMEDRVIHRSTDTSDYRLLIEPTPRWIRVVLNGVTIADSKRALLVDESKHMPVYYFPVEDVRDDVLQPGTLTRDLPVKGTATYHSIEVGGKVVENACWTFDDPAEEAAEPLRGHMAFYWHHMDHWFEEDEEVFVHPRDPRHRVDVCASSRHVQVVVGGPGGRRDPPTPRCSSRPTCRPATTSPSPTSAWTCSSPQRPSRSAPTRVWRRTTASRSATARPPRTSPGTTGSRSPRASRSRTSSASSTSGWTRSSWTVRRSRSPGRRGARSRC